MKVQRLRFAWRGPIAVAGAAGLLAILSLWIDPTPYQWVFGAADPAFVVAGIIVVGIPALVQLHRSGLFLLIRPGQSRRGLGAACGLAIMFAILVVLVDIVVGFPQAYNLPPPFPSSLLFYAVIGYVAETAFHVLPMAVVAMLTTGRSFSTRRETVLRVGMVAAACLEPIFQARLGIAGNGPGLTWAELFVFTHVFAINLVQLGLFRQFDFLTAYGFRLIYYLLWHIVWGALRQLWLF